MVANLTLSEEEKEEGWVEMSQIAMLFKQSSTRLLGSHPDKAGCQKSLRNEAAFVFLSQLFTALTKPMENICLVQM